MANRPQPYYARFNQPPRSPNGRNRQANPQNHSDPLNRADTSTRRPATRDIAQRATWTWVPTNGPINPLPQPDYSATDIIKLMADIQQDMIQKYYPSRVISPPIIPYAGITSGEITGYRGWLVYNEPSGPVLCSLAHQFIWQPGATIEGNIDECVYHTASNSIYGGVHAFREFSSLNPDMFGFMKWPWAPYSYDPTFEEMIGFAYGTVKLWGEIVEHETGYRASFAKLTSLIGFVGTREFDFEALKQKYGV